MVCSMFVLLSEVPAGSSQVLIPRRTRGKQSGATKSKGKTMYANVIWWAEVIR
jgi:hypothetical protein